MLQFNAHEVYEVLRTKRDNLSPHKSNGVALAIYPRVSKVEGFEGLESNK